MPGAGDPPRRRDHAEPAGDAPQPAQRVGQPAQRVAQPAQRVGQDRNDSPIRRAADSPADLRQRLNQFRDGHPSSPNHEDGGPREPAPDLSKFESAAEAHEHEPSSSGQAADRAEDAQDRAEGKAKNAEGQRESTDRGSEGWRAASPRLEALWERHAERWPAEQRSPVDRSTDEPGSWRGDDGRYLNFEENLATRHAPDRVCKAEPGVTKAMEIGR